MEGRTFQENGTSQEEHYIISLHEGSFFGEIALIDEKHRRSANVRAETFVELQVLNSTDFRSLFQVFPEFKSAATALAKSRLKTTETLGQASRASKVTGMGLTNAKTVGGPRSHRLSMGQQSTSKFTGAFRTKIRGVRIRCLTQAHVALQRLKRRDKRNRQGTQTTPESVRHRSNGSRSRPCVYDMIVSEGEHLSHEAALRVARGAGINRETIGELDQVSRDLTLQSCFPKIEEEDSDVLK
ncbi:unnamed protein product [Discosporangium mesarthrocarpum]